MLVIRRDSQGLVTPRWVCATCDRVGDDIQHWLLLFDVGDVEPVVVCSPACAADVRANYRRAVWQEQPLGVLVRDLAMTYGRAYMDCPVCRSPSARPVTEALLGGQPQRTVATRYGWSKRAIFSHSKHVVVEATR